MQHWFDLVSFHGGNSNELKISLFLNCYKEVQSNANTTFKIFAKIHERILNLCYLEPSANQ